ncbi:MAG: hypothetical protein KJO40_01925 [Deltaproteobacteria bacterium]|nr:hypothetical protein [Deltaproteobacteria bacterium]
MKPRTSSADCPRLELHNGGLRVSMYLPDAQRGYYRGTRFDWSGLIEQVECHGHRFYGPLHIEHDPYRHDSVGGPAEEFAMFHPMGFAEARPGESFVKIGVGLLERGENDTYRFDDEYRMVHPGEWVVEHGPAWVAFTQALHGERGWAYHYRKAIRLHECHSAFVIEHRLENRGDKTIDITNYNHNFTIIDDVPYGRDYVVEFPFSTDAPIPLGDIAWFRGSQIDVDRPLEDLALWWPVFEGDDPGNYNAAAVRNRRTGAAVAFRGDAPITRMVFWAVERAACPEPFIRIYLEPGRTQTWSTTYRFTVDAAPDHPQ